MPAPVPLEVGRLRPESGLVVEVERAEMEVGEEPVMWGRFGEARFGDVDQEVLAFR